MRIGHGFDVHRFGQGDHVMLGGMRIDCEYGVVAHSDGDVLIHALCDAMLGAAAQGDIGKHFPDNDPKWAGADSRELLKQVNAMLAEEGYVLVNADLTLVAETPRIAGHLPDIRAALASILDCDIGCINVKATTTEKLGYIGQREGLAAHAVVLVGTI